jgi:hypothetical protein
VALPPTTTPSEVTTTFNGSWTPSSPTLTRHADQQTKHFYYATIVVSASMVGKYSFTGNSVIDIDGDFDSADHNQNLSRPNVKTDGEERFRITISLQPIQKYVLIVSARIPETTGEFSIVSSGPATVYFQTKTRMPSTCEYRFVEATE